MTFLEASNRVEPDVIFHYSETIRGKTYIEYINI